MSAPRLADFLREEDLQRMQDAFAGAAGLSAVIVDEEGERITKPCNWAGFCGMLAGDAACAQDCRFHIKGMLQYNRESGLAAVTACPHTGLACTAVPFFFDGLHLGSWVLGQVKLSDGDEPRLGDVVRQMNMPPEAAGRMLARLPQHARAGFDSMLACLAALNDTVLRQGYERQDVENTAQDLWGLTRKLEDGTDQLRLLADACADGMYVADYATGEILLANEPLCAQLGQPMGGVLGRRCYQLNSSCKREGFCRKCPRPLLLDANGRPSGPHSWTLHAHKPDRWYQCTIRAVQWADGRPAYAVTRRDVTEAHLRQQLLERAAYRDRETGAANSERLLADLQGGVRGPAGSVWLVCFHPTHMDDFVKENGRQAATALLRAIAAWVAGEGFEQTALYRMGGYGFGLLMTGATRTKAVKLARCIKKRFTQPWMLELPRRRLVYNSPVTLALIAVDGAIDGDTLYQRIDDGLARSAQNGGFHIYDGASRTPEDLEGLDGVLADCVHNGLYGFDVHYQPIVDTATGVWKGLEALCRWNCPRHGSVPPAGFIPRAEAQGFIDTVGDWVLQQALKTCKSLHLDQVEDFFLTVNVTPMQMAGDGYPERVRELLALYGFPARKLALEVSECPQVQSNQSSQAAAMLLRRWGVRISLDDFGRAYASFDSLKCLPVSFVKPEQKLLRGIERDTGVQSYIYLMNEIVRASNIRLVAKGVENREQAEIMRKAGVGYMQGFLFARPMPGRELARRLACFTQAPGPLAYSPSERVNMGELLEGAGEYRVEPELFRLQNHCARLLLEQPSPEAAFEEVLGLLGAQLKAARAFAFVRVSDDYYSCIHHWCGKGVQPLNDGARQCVRLESGAPGVLEAFRENGALVAPSSAALSEQDRETLGGGNCSIVVFPMWNDKKLAGFMGLCAPEGREWRRGELILLWDLSLFMSESIRRERIRAHSQEKQMVQSQLLNNDGLSIYISDLDTDEILWANDAFKRQHGSMQCVGEKCHMVLHGNVQRCSFCKKGQLMQCATGGQLVSERFNEKLQKTLVVSDNLVQWENGKLVHIQYALDVSEQRVARRQLEVMSTTDALTGTANRAVLMQRLEAMLKKAEAGGKPAALAFVDVDCLKTVNDHQGHQEGDRLLCGTVNAIRQAVRKGDVIGRIGGDEFVVLFPGCNRQMAGERMEKALKCLQEERDETFSYGTAELAECTLLEGETASEKLLRLADERMLQHKREHVPEQLVRSRLGSNAPA